MGTVGVEVIGVNLGVGAGTFALVVSVPQMATIAATLATAGGIAILGLRIARPGLVKTAGVLSAFVLARKVGSDLDPGVLLVLAAFAAIPLATWIALRRERGRASAPTPAPERRGRRRSRTGSSQVPQEVS